MWGLDRLSAQSTPAPSPPPQQRPFSPAPRRSIHLSTQRPALSQRSSSLSLASVPTSNPVPSSARLPNGSGLKNQIISEPPADIEDPLVALQRLIGPLDDPAADGRVRQELLRPPYKLDGKIDFGGQSLESFADVHGSGVDSTTANRAPDRDTSVAQSEDDRTKFEELHQSIKNCDELLHAVETHLAEFRTDLGAVSAEIETLQARSTALNKKLDHRREADKLLAPVVDQIILSPVTVRKLADGPIDDAWMKALEEVQLKKEALDTVKLDEKKIKAVADLRPLIDHLSVKAVERIRDYLASRIKALRSPNINAQSIQQQGFLRHRSLFAFLANRQPQLAEDISQAYTNTMRWYYHTHFSRYEASLRKLRLHVVDKTDLLGEDPLSRSTTGSSAKLPGHAPFNLARRSDTLRNLPPNALPASTAEESKVPTYVETPFLFFNLALLDNASWEYSFLTGFYPPNGPLSNPRSISQQFQGLFAAVFELGQSLTKSLVADSFDALGILLAVRLTQHFAFVLQRRKVPTLESYVNGTSMLLWPRFQLVMDAHCDSLKRLTAALPNRPAGAAGAAAAFASLSGSGTSGPSTAPHPVTQRFANLVQGILALSSEAGDDEPVSASLARLRAEFEAFLNKMANSFGAGEKSRKEKARFLANNYSLVLTIIADTQGKLAGESKEHFTRLQAGVAK